MRVVDSYPAFGDEHLHGGVVLPDIERRADRDHRNGAGRHDERTGRILCDRKVNFSPHDSHPALGVGERHIDRRVGVELCD